MQIENLQTHHRSKRKLQELIFSQESQNNQRTKKQRIVCNLYIKFAFKMLTLKT